jgi:hypothetical protein
MLRIFFKYKRRLLGSLCQAAVRALLKYFQAATGTELVPGVVACIQTFGERINLHPHAHLLVSEGGEDKEGRFHHIQTKAKSWSVTSAYAELSIIWPLCQCSPGESPQVGGGGREAHHHRGGVSENPPPGLGRMIRKVYEVDPLVCSKCGGTMKVIAFITDYPVVDRIIDHLGLTFVASKPPPPHIAYQDVLTEAETSAEYFS